MAVLRSRTGDEPCQRTDEVTGSEGKKDPQWVASRQGHGDQDTGEQKYSFHGRAPPGYSREGEVSRTAGEYHSSTIDTPNSVGICAGKKARRPWEPDLGKPGRAEEMDCLARISERAAPVKAAFRLGRLPDGAPTQIRHSSARPLPEFGKIGRAGKRGPGKYLQAHARRRTWTWRVGITGYFFWSQMLRYCTWLPWPWRWMPRGPGPSPLRPGLLRVSSRSSWITTPL